MGCLKWKNSVSRNKIHDTNQQLDDARTASILEVLYLREVTVVEKIAENYEEKDLKIKLKFT
jgi:adenylate cyclase class IV